MLRTRLGLLIAVSILAALLAFGMLTEGIFMRQQRREMEGLLRRELHRVQRLVETSALGIDFLENEGGFELQFVAKDGRVVIPASARQALPHYQQPTLLNDADGTRLVMALPWKLPSGNLIGTIRLALDVGEAFAARKTLASSLIASGLIILGLTMLICLPLLRRALAPLQDLAAQAESIDAAHPRMIHYRGPQDEVAHVAHALTKALEAIRDRQQAERDALAEVAHELAAPLSVVAGHLGAVASEIRDQRLQAAREAAHELLYIAQDLLTVARGELELPLELATLDLAEVAADVAAQYPGVHVEGVAHAEILGSRERTVQALRNLVRNAVQACGDPTLVKIRLRHQEGNVLVDVIDQGPGLTDEDLACLFDRYYSRRGGTGVGLAVVKKIVERHDGTIQVRSEPGRATTFTICLPSLEAQLDPI